MATKQKLELPWIGKENRPRLEPRVLFEEPEKAHHAAHRVTVGCQPPRPDALFTPRWNLT